MEQNFVCKFCGSKFHKENTLSVHLCPKKRRQLEIETPPSRFGFRVFQRFFQLTTQVKKQKTTDDFINSPYYIDFVKFGHYLIDTKPINIDQFIDFVIQNGVKLKDWTREEVYSQYIEELVKKEPADAAIERSMTAIDEWANKNGTTMDCFFKSISANEAAFLISRGRISPWVLYLAESGGALMKTFNGDHAKLIGQIIDPTFWYKKFKSKTDDVEFISEVLKAAGL